MLVANRLLTTGLQLRHRRRLPEANCRPRHDLKGQHRADEGGLQRRQPDPGQGFRQTEELGFGLGSVDVVGKEERAKQEHQRLLQEVKMLNLNEKANSVRLVALL